MPPSHRIAHYSRVACALLLLSLGACSSSDLSEAELARGCIAASGDNRAKLAASWLSSAKVDVDGDRVTVRTEVPVGLSVSGKIKFRYWEYRCVRNAEGFEFLGYTVSSEKPGG